jgi:pyridoxamine 5'-phosphate oxidase
LSDIHHLRRDYAGTPLVEAEAGDDPRRLFARWFEEIRPLEADPTAMTLATASADGRPAARTVLLKDVDDRGFVFYTNFDSRKARDIEENNHVSLLFFWHSLERQVRVDGAVERVSDAEADAYFASRPLESRMSVYASRQSAPVESRAALDALFEQAKERFVTEGRVPRPDWWGGFRVLPEVFEFWQGRLHRMHDRLRYTKRGDGAWLRERLAP